MNTTKWVIGAGFATLAAVASNDGQPPKTLKAGDVFFVPAGVVHDGKNVGSGKAVVIATYVVEKGKPVATPAK